MSDASVELYSFVWRRAGAVDAVRKSHSLNPVYPKRPLGAWRPVPDLSRLTDSLLILEHLPNIGQFCGNIKAKVEFGHPICSDLRTHRGLDGSESQQPRESAVIGCLTPCQKVLGLIPRDCSLPGSRFSYLHGESEGDFQIETSAPFICTRHNRTDRRQEPHDEPSARERKSQRSNVLLVSDRCSLTISNSVPL